MIKLSVSTGERETLFLIFDPPLLNRSLIPPPLTSFPPFFFRGILINKGSVKYNSMRPSKISMVLFLSSLALLCTLAAAMSNVMLIEAEDTSLVTLKGDWQVIDEEGVRSVQTAEEGSSLLTGFFGTEFYLIAKISEDTTLKIEVDEAVKGNLSLESGEEYRQLKLVDGLDNGHHTFRLTLLSGNLSVDKLLMGSPTDIPEIKPRVEGDYYRASYNRPWILQDSGGTYWLTFEVQSLQQPADIYVTHSADGIHWDKPKPAVASIYHDYDSAVVLDDAGEFWMVFTRIEPVNSRVVNQPYYTHSADGIHWDTPRRITIPQDNAYYPYLYYDADTDSFIFLYASSSVEGGDFHDNIYIVRTSALDNISEPLRITDNSMDSSYYPTLIKDAEGEFWLYFVSPLLGDENVFANHNDVFVMHSSDLKHWSKPVLVTDGNKTVAYNYIHPAYRKGSYYLAIMSSQSGVEDAYIMSSEDGVHFTSPRRMIEHDEGNIIDYKSMFVDREGILWMAYSHVMEDGSRAVFVVNSSDGIHWNTPIRVTPLSNIFGELWLESEPMPESVRRLVAELENGSEPSGRVREELESRFEDDVPKSGFSTLFLALVSILSLGVLKRWR
jgi:hypothetical protein